MRYSLLILCSSCYLLMVLSCREVQPVPDQGQVSPDETVDSLLLPKEERIRKTGLPTFDSLVATYESTERINWQKPDRVISLMGDLSDKTVADIGAGTGYFSFRFLPHASKVIAIDIDTLMTRFMEESRKLVPDNYRDLLEVRLADRDDPKISKGEADIIFLANTYTYIDNRIEYFRHIYRLLPENGTLVIVDFKKKRTPIGPLQEDKVPLYILEQEMQSAGFDDYITDDQSLPYQYIFIGRKREGSSD